MQNIHQLLLLWGFAAFFFFLSVVILNEILLEFGLLVLQNNQLDEDVTLAFRNI